MDEHCIWFADSNIPLSDGSHGFYLYSKAYFLGGTVVKWLAPGPFCVEFA
uniref:Uncharacterized protein n=1 Tax=Anguilla anguilla TaxID=7936 RepID=A0A0E9REH9_ANGAN